MVIRNEFQDGPLHVEKSEIDAKQGIELHRMRYVLAFGVIGTICAFAVVYWLVNT